MVMKEIGDIEEQLSDFEKIREQYPNDAERMFAEDKGKGYYNINERISYITSNRLC